MANRRIIFSLLFGIALSALLLWGLQRRERLFPSKNKAQAVLLEHTLAGVDRVTVERGDTRIGLLLQDGR